MVVIAQDDLLGVSAAVTASVQSGLFGALAASDSATAAELVAQTGLDLSAVSRVLDVLVAVGLVEQAGQRFAVDADLVARHAAFPGGVALTAGLFTLTPQYLLDGKTELAMDGDPGERSAAYQSTVAGLGQLFAPAAAALAKALPPCGGHILDVGCGSGIWSLALARRSPDAHVTGLDWPEVLTVFASEAESAGLSQRVHTVAGNMHEARLPRADVVLLANVLRLEPAERAKALLVRLADAVAPGGCLVVVDALAGGDQAREVARSVYALHLALRTRSAVVHGPGQVADWLQAAGLAQVQLVDFGVWPGAVAAVVAQRPALGSPG